MRRVLAYVALLAMLAACALGDLTSGDGQESWVDLNPTDLPGLWQSDRGDTIEFTSDGYFLGDDLKYIFTGDQAAHYDLSQDTAAASGQWELASAVVDPNSKRAFVKLDFDVIANQPASVTSDLLAVNPDDNNDQIQLVYRGGDSSGDLPVVHYRRCDSTCTPVIPDRPPPGVATAPGRDALTGAWSDQNGAQLLLNPDGTYAADDLRFAWVGAEVLLPAALTLRDGPLSSTGTWSTKPSVHDPASAETTIELAITTVESRPSFGVRRLRIYTDGPNLILATVSSNPDVIEQHIYHHT